MKPLVPALAVLLLAAPVHADSDACHQARQDALEPISRMVQATMKLAQATAAGCKDLKTAWAEYRKVNAASEVAMKKVETVCKTAPAEKADHSAIEELVRACDSRK